MQWLQWFHQTRKDWGGGGDAEATYGFWNAWWFGIVNIHMEVSEYELHCLRLYYCPYNTTIQALFNDFHSILRHVSAVYLSHQQAWILVHKKAQKWLRSLLTNSGSKIIATFYVYYSEKGIITGININRWSMLYRNPVHSPLTYLTVWTNA